MRFKVHPLFILLIVVSAFTDSFVIVIETLLCVIIHELAHCYAAYSYGYKLNYVMLMPYGAMLKGQENMRDREAVIIALFGPFINLLIAVFIIALWWIYPALYPLTELLVVVNISLAVFNLIPAYPLDGSLVLLSILKNKNLALIIVRIIGLLVSIALMGIFILSIFYSINYTYGIASIFLLCGSIFQAKNYKYAHYTASILSHKKVKNGVELKKIIISYNATLLRALRFQERGSIVEFNIVDNKMKVIKIISEDLMLSVYQSYSLNTTLKQALNLTEKISK